MRPPAELWKSFKFWVSDTIASRKEKRKAPDSLARTARDATHSVTGRGAAGSFGSGGRVHDLIGKAHQNYQKSLKKFR